MIRRILFLFILTSFTYSEAIAANTFDAPLDKQYMHGSPTEGGLACYYFPVFMVKEIGTCIGQDCDGKDEGTARLAIVPLQKGNPRPACRGEADPNELPVTTAGHFLGAKSQYVFFMESPDVGNTLEVYDAKSSQSAFQEKTWDRKISAVTLSGSKLTFRFKRADLMQCPVDLDPKPCWNTIKAKIKKELNGVHSAIPDCTKQLRTGHELLIGYNAEAVFDGSSLETVPLPGPIECSATL